MMLASGVFVPLLAAGLGIVLPARLARVPTLLAALWTLLVGGLAVADFVVTPGADWRWLGDLPVGELLGGHLGVGVDALGAVMLLLSGLVTAVATLGASDDLPSPRAYHGLVGLLLAATNGVFVARDLLSFYIAWEFVLLPMLFLIGRFGGAQRRYAAVKFVVVTLGASVPMLAAMVLLWNGAAGAPRSVAVPAAVVAAVSMDGGRTVHGLPVVAAVAPAPATVTVPADLDLRHLALQHERWAGLQFLGVPLAWFGFLAVLLACLVKLPAVPLHTWLPHAHVQAPTGVSVLLAGVLLKLGVFGLLRVAMPLFPGPGAAALPGLGWLGAIGILWAAYVALGQSDLKRLVAYASVSHMGFCLLGIAAGNATGLAGAMVQAVTHGLGSPLLFLLVGALYERAHHRRLDGFGGLCAPMPRFGWLFLFAALAGAGLPGLGGFPGEFLALLGAFLGDGPLPWLAAAAALSVVLSAAYLLGAVRKVVYGPLREPSQAAFPDLSRRELAAMAPLVVGLLVFGVWPKPLYDLLRPALDLLVVQLGGGR